MVGTMQVEFGVRVVDVLIPQATGQPLGVVVASPQEQGMNNVQRQYNCRLLVGADGASSVVRDALLQAQPGTGWEMVETPSPSAGLQIKVRTASMDRARNRRA
jgi:2-polyprenyl-6-methoxyphenol hydroxylase-like FAD-dependent oxidoreductase